MRKKLLFVTLLMASTILFADDYSRAGDIVTNHTRGIQWQDTPYTAADEAAYNSQTVESERARQWIHAAGYCTNLNLDGGGWRLPTYDELDSVIDTSRSNPAINPIFENALGLGTWSGTTYPDNTDQAWGVGFYSGEWHHCTKDNKSKLIMCVREGSSTPPENQAPVAKAGPDQTVIEGDTVTLDGSSSTDPDGTITAYVWEEGSTVLSREVSFDKIFSAGTHTITLTVTDNDDATKSDNVTVTVAPVNTPPTADAGPNKSVQVNETVSITGSGTDTDGTIASYEWKKGTTVVATTASFDYTPTAVGTDTLTLTVTDNDGATGTDSMTVTVTAAPPVNTPPTANAGPDRDVQVGNTITITGTGSDSEGAVTYEWKKGGTVLADTASFDYTPSTVGTDTLTFTVTDDDGETASDTMVVTVTAAPPVDTTPPVITLSGTNPMSIVQGSTFTDPGATATDNVDGTVAVTESGTVDTLTVGSYTRTYTATDAAGNTATEIRTVNVVASSWYTFENDGSTVTYTTVDDESAVELDFDLFNVEAKDGEVVFTGKKQASVGDCLVQVYITMKSNGDMIAGYTHEGNDCTNDTNGYAPGTKVSVGSDDMALLIKTPLTDDLTLGGK